MESIATYLFRHDCLQSSYLKVPARRPTTYVFEKGTHFVNNITLSNAWATMHQPEQRLVFGIVLINTGHGYEAMYVATFLFDDNTVAHLL